MPCGKLIEVRLKPRPRLEAMSPKLRASLKIMTGVFARENRDRRVCKIRYNRYGNTG
jgi:hypothetical protein